MTEFERGTDRLGRRAKRLLTPLQKYKIWLQLLRGETPIGEAADRYGVDRSTIMRLRTVAKDGALAALAESKSGVAAAKRDVELEAAMAEAARLGEAVQELAVELVLVEGKGRWGGTSLHSGTQSKLATGPMKTMSSASGTWLMSPWWLIQAS